MGWPRNADQLARADTAQTTSEPLLADLGFVRLVRWVFTSRLVCLALAAPAALTSDSTTAASGLSLCLLTLSSLVFSRSDRLIRTLIRHPLLASIDMGVSIALLISIPSGQPAALTGCVLAWWPGCSSRDACCSSWWCP